MKLRQVGSRTYYIEHDTNIGVYVLGDNKVCLIDTGSRGDGQKIDDIMMEQGWTIEYIINTHDHIDHLGGNDYLMKKYGIPAYCSDFDRAFAEYEDLEAAYMNGGFPADKLRNIYKHPGKIGFESIEEHQLEGISWTYLKGHSFGMIGVKTDDDVWFLGDAYLSEAYLNRFLFAFLTKVDEYLESLHKMKTLKGNMFIPSHGIAEDNIENILNLNIKNVENMIAFLKDICSDYMGIDDIVKQMYERLNIRPRAAQHAMMSSTAKSYLSYLQDRNELECKFIDNIMKWKINDF